MHFNGQQKVSRAFALPTVLIASIVLLMVLAVSVNATAAVRTALQNQYYIQLAQVAGESGVAYAKACLAANGNVPQWTDAKPLTPATDCSGNVILSPNVQALVVGGGGGGGSRHGGGGGAGGLIYNSTVGIAQQSYPIVVGSGGAGTANGAGGTDDTATNGGNSSALGFTAIGGGAGRGSLVGVAGGSGGGGGANAAGGSGTAGQGYAGGAGLYSTYYMGGGGGGAGGAGTNAAYPSSIESAGGSGVVSSITGSSLTYAAGGKGGSYNLNTVGVAGAANTGNGGGGAGGETNGGAAGGSGVVIISYPINSGIVASGGTVTTSGNYKIHKFTSSGNFVVTSAGSTSCPSDPKCSVTVNGNIRSSFSVPKPTVDANGQALTIPNSGYTQILRTSNGAVWRTYKQPSVQAAVVPDLCSGDATAARGWSAAVLSSSQDALPSASTADSITLATGNLLAGPIYFRKDFNVNRAASYDLNVLTNTSQDVADTYIDKALISRASGSLSTTSMTLTTGCHTIIVRLTNMTTLPRATDFTLSLTRTGAAGGIPLVVSDPTWRVTAGDSMHFSQNNYYEASTTWDQAFDLGVWNNTTLPWGGGPSGWLSVSGDNYSNWLSTQYSGGGVNRPPDSYTWLRQATPFTLATATNVRVTNYCDDQCILYLDGQQVMSLGASAGIVSKLITIQAGTHTFGVRLYNGPSTPNPSAMLFAAINPSTGAVIVRSDAGWDATNFWTNPAVEPYSYDETFQPTPNSLGTTNVKVLVVGGGGSGGGGYEAGGGGAGGFVYDAAHPVTSGTYAVTVGAGGAGGTIGATNPGGYSVFDTLRAVGGGYGASEPNSGAIFGLPGGSGGGSSHPQPAVLYTGAFAQGNVGGAGITGNPYVGGGGGGAGAAGQNATTSKAGDGGAGISNLITGSAVYYAGGGGGAFRSGTNGAGGNGGGGAGSSTTGVYGTSNTGGGGGAGGNSSATGVSGSGGSGVVIISYPTGALNVSAVVGATDISSSTPGFTTWKFTANGYITIGQINS